MPRSKHLTNIVEINKIYLKNYIKAGDIVVDATMGNGFDTKYLKESVGKYGKVIAFDIQKEALRSTEDLLKKNNLFENVILINDGHENLLKYIKNDVSCVVFNLGYLPKMSHKIKTTPKTTLKAMDSSLKVLKKNGILSMSIYTGHTGGIEERNAVYKYIKSLSQNEYSVLENKFLNQMNNPPELILIEKNI